MQDVIKLNKLLLFCLVFIFKGCDDKSLTDINVDTTLTYRKWSDNLSKLCNTSHDNFSYTCEHHSNGIIKSLTTHEHEKCLSGEENSCFLSRSNIEWFDDFYVNCVETWDFVENKLNNPYCTITSFNHIER